MKYKDYGEEQAENKTHQRLRRANLRRRRETEGRGTAVLESAAISKVSDFQFTLRSGRRGLGESGEMGRLETEMGRWGLGRLSAA